jgi:UPF0271 protein
MNLTVKLCKELGVSVGAHTSFPDLVGFATANGTRLQHVSPNGRLGNLAVTRPSLRPSRRTSCSARRPTLNGGVVSRSIDRRILGAGLRYGVIGFANRAYRSDGALVPRTEPGAVLEDEDQIQERVLRMVVGSVVTSIDGVDLPMTFDSILLHGDNEKAVLFASCVRERLIAADLRIALLADVVAARMASSSA